MFRDQMDEYVEVSREIVKVMISDNAAAALKKSLEREESVISSLIDAQISASDLLREFLSVEEKVAHTFLETEETKRNASSKLHQIERELQDVCEKNASMETNIKFLQKEVEDLKRLEDEIVEVEREAQEDTTVVIPSALYMAKLFHSVTKIDWDYSCDSALIKGIHYGGDVAQPICIDSTQHSKMFTCDYLWSLLSTDW